MFVPHILVKDLTPFCEGIRKNKGHKSASESSKMREKQILIPIGIPPGHL